jgi:molybdopterin converting factor subunit 1
MIVMVQLFARARELAGSDSIPLTLADGATVAALRQELARTFPHMAGLIAKCAVALNDDYVDDSCFLPADAQVALLPPVSGG